MPIFYLIRMLQRGHGVTNALLYCLFVFLFAQLQYDFYQSYRNNHPIHTFLLLSVISGCNFSNWRSCYLWVNKRALGLKTLDNHLNIANAFFAYIHSHPQPCDESEAGGTRCRWTAGMKRTTQRCRTWRFKWLEKTHLVISIRMHTKGSELLRICCISQDSVASFEWMKVQGGFDTQRHARNRFNTAYFLDCKKLYFTLWETWDESPKFVVTRFLRIKS